MFTNGQRYRARAALKGPRKDILTSKGVILETDTNEAKKYSVELSPNPSKGMVKINLKNHSNQIPKIYVYDLAGNQISFKQNVTNQSIDLELLDFKSGVHLIVLNYGDHLFTSKISMVY